MSLERASVTCLCSAELVFLRFIAAATCLCPPPPPGDGEAAFAEYVRRVPYRIVPGVW